MTEACFRVGLHAHCFLSGPAKERQSVVDKRHKGVLVMLSLAWRVRITHRPSRSWVPSILCWVRLRGLDALYGKRLDMLTLFDLPC